MKQKDQYQIYLPQIPYNSTEQELFFTSEIKSAPVKEFLG